MNVGINFNIDNDKALFYNTYYDVVDSPDFNNATRLLKPKHGIKTIGYQNKKSVVFVKKANQKSLLQK